jgi:GntR family transcriptional regulator, transcriptional repressor for pyruvate dehydrogenase complex
MSEPMSDLAGLAPRREPISNEVAQVLLTYLMRGDYKPGQRLPSERALAEALGVGRSVIREVLKSLTLLGLIQVRPGDGTYLKDRGSDFLPASFEWGLLLGDRQVQDVIEARRELEVVLAGLAAERRTDTDVDDLRTLLARMKSAPDKMAFVEADVAFHLRIAEAARNPILQQMLGSTQSLLRAWVLRVVENQGDTAPSYREHTPVFAAIEKQDPDAARTAIRSHLQKAGQRLTRALAEQSVT